MPRGRRRGNNEGKVTREMFVNSNNQHLPFHEGMYAAHMGMLPLPPSEKSANDFNEGYDYAESILGVPQEARNTHPKGQ